MQAISRSGRFLYALAILAFGIIQFASGNFLSSLFPIPDATPARKLLFILVSILFIVIGPGIMINKTSRRSAVSAGILFLILLIYPHLFKLLQDLHNGGEWTVFSETAAFCGGSLIVSGTMRRPYPGTQPANALTKSGYILFSVSLLIFGTQHFLYAGYIATLIPAWIPVPLFWSYFVGIAFIASAFSILIKIKTGLACALLSFMFLFWVIFVHIPRVWANPHKETEWTSLFVALGMCGIFLALGQVFHALISGTSPSTISRPEVFD